MARSNNFKTNNKYIVYWITATQLSQSITNNTSRVRVRVYVKRTNTGYTTYGSGTIYCTINGKSYSKSITPSQKITSTSLKLYENTVTIPHNSDGTKKLQMSARISHSRFSSSTNSWSMTLSTIPRKSSFTINDFVIGDDIPISISRKSTSFTHNFSMYQGSTFIGEWLTKVGTSTTLTLNSTHQDRLYQAMSNSAKSTVKIVCRTYQGSKLIGTTNKYVFANVPSDVVPTFNDIIHSEYVTNVKDIVGAYVQRLSRLNIEILGAEGVKHSTIKSYEIKFDGNTYKSKNIITNTVKNSGSIPITCKVTDSRGRSSTKTITINVLPYSPPKLTQFTLVRCDLDGTENAIGEYVAVNRTGNISSLTVNGIEKNVQSWRIRTKLRGTDRIDPLILDKNSRILSFS